MSDETVVDARGQRCPVPVIMLARAVRAVPAGTVVTLLSTDPATEADVAAWCRLKGCHLVGQHREPTGVLRSRVTAN